MFPIRSKLQAHSSKGPKHTVGASGQDYHSPDKKSCHITSQRNRCTNLHCTDVSSDSAVLFCQTSRFSHFCHMPTHMDHEHTAFWGPTSWRPNSSQNSIFVDNCLSAFCRRLLRALKSFELFQFLSFPEKANQFYDAFQNQGMVYSHLGIISCYKLFKSKPVPFIQSRRRY